MKALLTKLGVLKGEPLALGERLPEAEALDQDGQAFALAERLEKGFALVFFFPRANTPGCTAQACSLRDAYEELTDAGVTVVGVSMGSVAAMKSFAQGKRLPFTLLADERGEVAEAFGAHRLSFAHVTTRQAFLFRDGKLIWRDLSASTTRQAADVLRAARESESAH